MRLMFYINNQLVNFTVRTKGDNCVVSCLCRVDKKILINKSCVGLTLYGTVQKIIDPNPTNLLTCRSNYNPFNKHYHVRSLDVNTPLKERE